MKKPKKQTAPKQSKPREPHRVRLPGFLVKGEVGLGDAIKHVTGAVGIKSCGGCEGRAQALNRWMIFTR